MGLMDKVKAQANQLAQKTQEAAQEGKARLDQAQANRRGDVLLRQLGALVFAERTGRGTPESQSKIDDLINTISAHERENGLNLSQAPAPPPGPQGDQPGAGSAGPGASPGQGTSSYPGDAGPAGAGPAGPGPAGAGPAGSSQDVPGGFATGQTFFPPPEDT